MVSPTLNEDKVDSIIQVTQTFRSSTDLQDFRNWLLDLGPSKKDGTCKSIQSSQNRQMDWIWR